MRKPASSLLNKFWAGVLVAGNFVLSATAAPLLQPKPQPVTWPGLVAAAGPLATDAGKTHAIRLQLRKEFTCISNSFFPAADSLEKWQKTPDCSYNLEMLARVLQSLSQTEPGKRSALEVRCDALVKTQKNPHHIAWLDLYQEAYETLKGQALARVPEVAMVQRAPNSLRGTNAVMFAIQPSELGTALCIYDPANPAQKARRILENPEGYLFDASASYDGKKLLLTYKQKPEEPYHVWEIETNGKGLRQITSGPYYDVSPVYYPDGRIIFTSSRVESYSMCQNFLACALHVCKEDGSDIRRFDFTTLSTLTPAVMPDGSIVCTRWEYADKNIFSWQGLWTINPDGRQLKLYYGNTLTIPNSRYGPKPIPNDDKVLITMAAHHHPPVGDIAIIDRSKGVESLEGFRQITFETPFRPTKGENWRDTNWKPGDYPQSWAYADPFPIAKDLFLVAYGGPHPNEGGSNQFRICLLTDRGVVFDFYNEPGVSFYNPIPLAPRAKPRAISGEVPTEAGEGSFFVQDIYQGLTSQGVERGQVKELRVWQQIPKKYNTEGPRYLDHYPLVGFGTYYVKRNLGSVPVDENGSAYFKAPSNVELYFQALDKEGREISRMGSVTQITTGETVSCIGCHENRLSPPTPARGTAMLRLQRPPDSLQAPSWGAGNVDYVKQVQAVLDQYCVKCHSGPKPDGNIDLSGDKTRFFNLSYDNLIQKGWVEYYWLYDAPTSVFPALKTGSRVSRLTKLLEAKHQGVEVDPEGLRRIYCWIDANVPYYGTWEMSRPYTIGGRDSWSLLGTAQLAPWATKVVKGAAEVQTNRFRNLDLGVSNSLHLQVNMTHPEWSQLLVTNLAQSAGGTAPDTTAIFRSNTSPRYQEILAAIKEGKRSLEATPRMDMPGAVSIPQERDFGKVFSKRAPKASTSKPKGGANSAIIP